MFTPFTPGLSVTLNRPQCVRKHLVVPEPESVWSGTDVWVTKESEEVPEGAVPEDDMGGLCTLRSLPDSFTGLSRPILLPTLRKGLSTGPQSFFTVTLSVGSSVYKVLLCKRNPYQVRLFSSRTKTLEMCAPTGSCTHSTYVHDYYFYSCDPRKCFRRIHQQCHSEFFLYNVTGYPLTT